MSLDHQPLGQERVTGPRRRSKVEAPTTISNDQDPESNTRNIKPNKRSRFNQAPKKEYPTDIDSLPSDVDLNQVLDGKTLREWLKDPEFAEEYRAGLEEEEAEQKQGRSKKIKRAGALGVLGALVVSGGFIAAKLGMGGSSEEPGAEPRPTATANLEPTPEVPSYMTVERLAYPDVDHLAVDSFESYEDVFAKFEDLESYGLNKEPEIFPKFMEPSCKLLTLDSSLNKDLNEDRIISDQGEGSDEDRIRRSGIMLEPNYIEPHFITQKYGVEWEELGYDKSTWFAVIAKRNVIDIENGETKKVHDYDELKFLFVKREEPETGEQRWYLSEFGWPNEHDYEAAGLEPPEHAPGIDGSPEAP